MRQELRSDDVLLFISYDGGTNYSTVICLTNNGITRAKSAITSKTKCGTTSVAGSDDVAISFEGNIWTDPDAGETSVVDLIDLFNNNTTFYWKMGPAVPVDGQFVHSGQGFLSQLDESYAVDSAATFTGAITPSGDVTTTDATS
jgi:hypothetical protein